MSDLKLILIYNSDTVTVNVTELQIVYLVSISRYVINGQDLSQTYEHADFSNLRGANAT